MICLKWEILDIYCLCLQVKKVVTFDARMIATIAEDNVLRIWDKKKIPIRQDLSDFTGK